jgi:hypothetical protein|mmetsp:Transcript_56778/g.88399  ORF Transcript_56778/g.88399 Transcript_56778/m.88399 type:complete len:459 (+) Transcript_56778:91-1467(+)
MGGGRFARNAESDKHHLVLDLKTRVSEKLKEWPAESEAWALNNGRLRRFLVGNQGDVGKALDQMAWCVDFRTQLAAWNVDPIDVKEEMQLGKFYCRSLGNEGHPIIMYRHCRADHTLCPQLQMRALVFCLDHLEQKLDQDCYVEDGRWVVILDMYGKPVKGSVSAEFFMMLTRTFVRCYPERLHRLFIVDAGSFIRGVWTMACKSTLVRKDTAEKVIFPRRRQVNGRLVVPELLEQIGKDALEEDYGGNDGFSWNTELHWNVIHLAPPSLQNSLIKIATEAATVEEDTASTNSGATSWFSLPSLQHCCADVNLCQQALTHDAIELVERGQQIGSGHPGKLVTDTCKNVDEQHLLRECQSLRSHLIRIPSTDRNAVTVAKLAQLHRELSGFLKTRSEFSLCDDSLYQSSSGKGGRNSDAGLIKWKRAANWRLRCIVALCILIVGLVLTFSIARGTMDCN